MPYVANTLLDAVPGRGQQAQSVEYELLDRVGNRIGNLYPETPGARITCDGNANIVKQLSGLVIGADVYADIDPFGDRVSPYFVLEDDTRWPLGTYHFTGAPDDTEVVHAAPLFDSGIVLDAKLDRSYGVNTSRPVADAIAEVWHILGFRNAVVAGSDANISNDQPIGWGTGQQTWAYVLRYLHKLAGFVPPYFTHDDVPMSVPPLPLAVGSRTITYATVDDRIEPKPVTDPDLLDAPNVYIVLSAGATTDEAFGIAFIDPALPWSKEHRGFTVPDVERMQGIASSSQCTAIAQRKADVSADQFTTLEFTGPPDPRHDAFEVIAVDDVAYRELSWDLELVPGGSHKHRVARSEGVSLAT